MYRAFKPIYVELEFSGILEQFDIVVIWYKKKVTKQLANLHCEQSTLLHKAKTIIPPYWNETKVRVSLWVEILGTGDSWGWWRLCATKHSYRNTAGTIWNHFSTMCFKIATFLNGKEIFTVRRISRTACYSSWLPRSYQLYNSSIASSFKMATLLNNKEVLIVHTSQFPSSFPVYSIRVTELTVPALHKART